MHHGSANSFARHQPPETSPRVVTGNARSVGARADRQAHLQHPSNRRLPFCGFDSVAADVVFALISHAMLNGNAAAERGDTFHVLFSDRFAVIYEPTQVVDWRVAVNSLEDVEKAADRFVVGSVDPPWPAGLGELSHY